MKKVMISEMVKLACRRAEEDYLPMHMYNPKFEDTYNITYTALNKKNNIVTRTLVFARDRATGVEMGLIKVK